MICINTSFVYKGKKILLLLLIMITISKTHWSQKNEIGILLGGANYFGILDLIFPKQDQHLDYFLKNITKKKYPS